MMACLANGDGAGRKSEYEVQLLGIKSGVKPKMIHLYPVERTGFH